MITFPGTQAAKIIYNEYKINIHIKIWSKKWERISMFFLIRAMQIVTFLSLTFSSITKLFW